MSDKNDSLINRLTSKRNSGEITEEEYQELLLKFTKLGLLDSLGIDKDRKNWIISGSETRDGEIVNGSVSVSGKLHVEGSLECERLSV
ncbi:MAG: hypothetical protein OEZ01_07905, partial [Candidatus Heimdallarchaeota archaeon]|nr:hypothetical protein [Candidatus Heimdallarchaeota archaeon]